MSKILDESFKKESSSFMGRISLGVKRFFTGDEGSVFWAIGQLIQLVRDIIAGVNSWLAARRAEKRMRDIDE